MTTLRQAAVAALEALEITSSEYCQGCWLEVIAALKEALAQPDQLEDCKKILIERTTSLTKANYRLEQLNKQEPVAVVTEEMEFSNYQSTNTGRLIIVPIKEMAESGLQNGDKLYLHPAPIPEGWQLVPIEPTEEMIDCGAQGMASFQEDSVWPDSWDAIQVKGMRHDATKAYRYMLSAAPKYEEQEK